MPRTLAPLWMIALAACACPSAPEPASAPPAPAPTEEPGPPPPNGPNGKALLGDWHSPACGDRAYERRLHLHENGSFKAEDMVSPCPPGVMCVWSGIVETQGTWAVSKGALELTVKAGAAPRRGVAPFPTALTLDGAGAPAEGSAGASSCPYVR
jgi:hypothetical protein